MIRKSLKQRLAAYFMKQHSAWISGGELERISIQFSIAKPSTVGRRLRELAEAGTLERKMEKGTVFYRHAPSLLDHWNATT